MSHQHKAKSLLDNDFAYIQKEAQSFLLAIEKKYLSDLGYNKFLSKNIHTSLIEVLNSVLLSDGKRIRPLFCFWIYRHFCEAQNKHKIPLKNVVKIALAIEVLHNASLIIDDIEDGSDTRREAPAIHKVFGLPIALNAASWMYFLAINYLPKKLQPIATSALAECHIGQGIDLSSSRKECSKDLFWATSKERWEYYEKCVSLKTTRLILLSLELIQKTFKLKASDYKFTQNLIARYGIVYQMFDDLKNIFPDLSGQKHNEDLHAGFRSAVSLEFLDMLSQQERTVAYKKYEKNEFLDYMLAHNQYSAAVQSCFKKAETLLNETSVYIDQKFGKIRVTRKYLSYLFELPFRAVKESIENKIKLEVAA